MNEILLNKVRDYFSGNMSREEQAQLESERATNRELATIFDLYQTIEHGVTEAPEFAAEEALLRNTLKGAHERFLLKHGQEAPAPVTNIEEGLLSSQETEIPETKVVQLPAKETGKVRRMTAWKGMAVAAAITGVLITAAVWFLQKDKTGQDITAEIRGPKKPVDTVTPEPARVPAPQPEDYTAKQDAPKTPVQQDEKPKKKPAAPSVPGRAEQEKLYARNFKPDALPSNYSELLQDALNQYKDREYEDAVAAIDIKAIETYMEEIRPRGQQDEQLEREERQTLFYAHYYKALSYMGEGKTEKAIPAFQKALAKSPDNYWQSKAQWYLALAYLKNGKLKEAITRLKQVAQAGKAGEYRQKAIKLISELEGTK